MILYCYVSYLYTAMIDFCFMSHYGSNWMNWNQTANLRISLIINLSELNNSFMMSGDYDNYDALSYLTKPATQTHTHTNLTTM